jgi:hypothetical protein
MAPEMAMTPLWYRWFEHHQVALDPVGEGVVLTRTNGDRTYETVVFGGPFDDFRDHYSTSIEAQVGHMMMVREVQEYEDVA